MPYRETQVERVVINRDSVWFKSWPNWCTRFRHHGCIVFRLQKQWHINDQEKLLAFLKLACSLFLLPPKSSNDAHEMQSERYIKTLCKIATKMMKNASIHPHCWGLPYASPCTLQQSRLLTWQPKSSLKSIEISPSHATLIKASTK